MVTSSRAQQMGLMRSVVFAWMMLALVLVCVAW
jgi:hypothetical protein